MRTDLANVTVKDVGLDNCVCDNFLQFYDTYTEKKIDMIQLTIFHYFK